MLGIKAVIDRLMTAASTPTCAAYNADRSLGRVCTDHRRCIVVARRPSASQHPTECLPLALGLLPPVAPALRSLWSGASEVVGYGYHQFEMYATVRFCFPPPPNRVTRRNRSRLPPHC